MQLPRLSLGGPTGDSPLGTLVTSDTDLAAHAGEQIFGVSRYSDDDPDGSRNDLDTIHTFPAAPPDHGSIHPDWVDKITASMCEKHLGGLVGDGIRALRPPLKRASPNHMAVAVQNVTGSCKPYRTAGFPNDDCRFAAWTAMVKSGLVDIAFLVDAHCGPVDMQKCQAHTRSMGGVATKGAPTTTQTPQRLVDPAEGLLTIRGIQPGGILMLINPTLQSRIIHTTHRCSGRLFLVHLRHGTDGLVIVALYGASAPKADDTRFMRAQLATAMTQIAGEYAGTPMLVVGDLNSAASPGDRGTGELLPYGRVSGALTNVLTRLSFTDVHRHKFPPERHYKWSNSTGRKSRIGAVYANKQALAMAGAGAWRVCCIAILLNMACFIFSVCLVPFDYT